MFDVIAAVANVANVLGSLSLVISVLLLMRELRENNRLTRAANAQALVQMSAPYYLGLAQDRALAELSDRSANDFESLDSVDRTRFRRLLIWWLIFYENIYYQRRQKLLDNMTFQAWWRDLCLFLREQRLERHWAAIRYLYQDEFAQVVDDMLAHNAGTAVNALVRRPEVPSA